MNSGSCAPEVDRSEITCSIAEDFFLTERPCCWTSCGSLATASWTRLFTLTVFWSGSVPRAKLTSSV